MALRPLHDRILVQRIEEEEQKVGGIIIPDSAKEKPQQGKVVAVGAGKADKDGKRIPLDVKDGDTILFGKYSGQEVRGRWRGLPDHARGRSARRDRGRQEVVTTGDSFTWQSRLFTASSRARRSCAASTSWRTRSR